MDFNKWVITLACALISLIAACAATGDNDDSTDIAKSHDILDTPKFNTSTSLRCIVPLVTESNKPNLKVNLVNIEKSKHRTAIIELEDILRQKQLIEIPYVHDLDTTRKYKGVEIFTPNFDVYQILTSIYGDFNYYGFCNLPVSITIKDDLVLQQVKIEDDSFSGLPFGVRTHAFINPYPDLERQLLLEMKEHGVIHESDYDYYISSR